MHGRLGLECRVQGFPKPIRAKTQIQVGFVWWSSVVGPRASTKVAVETWLSFPDGKMWSSHFVFDGSSACNVRVAKSLAPRRASASDMCMPQLMIFTCLKSLRHDSGLTLGCAPTAAVARSRCFRTKFSPRKCLNKLYQHTNAL